MLNDATFRFLDTMRAAGLEPPDVIEPGKFMRFPGVGKEKGNTAGWCRLFPDGAGGVFGDWSSDLSETWQAEQDKPLPPVEREAFNRRVEEAQAQAEAERKAQQCKAAKQAFTILNAAKPAPEDHPYLVRKGIKPHGAQVYNGALLIPLRNKGELQSLQYIQANGEKRFLKDGRVSGCYFEIGDPESAQALCIVEGFATGATIHEATGYPVVVAFNASNLHAVAQSMRECFPKLKLIVCADDDVGTEGNPGMTKAKEAALAVSGWLAVPEFGNERTAEMTDFNDMAAKSGLQAVKEAIDKAVEPVVRFPIERERPCWRVYDNPVEYHGRKYPPGVYYHGIKERGDGPPALNDDWVSAPLHVDAITTDREDGEHGRLLRFISTTGRWKKWAMPMAMLSGDGNEARQVLLSDGLIFDIKKPKLVLQYIASQQPKQRLRAATTTGWHDGAFVLPNEVIGADDIWFQSASRHAPYGTAGTLEGWQNEVAAKAVGNPAIALAICASLAGPLLESLNIDGGGIHFYGDSSTGKTTALMAAISSWGGPDFRRTWRATANGLEGAARMHTSTLLALDEIGEINPRELYEAIYALGNGHGKSRANVYGEARKVARWRVYICSTGEVTLSSRMAAGGLEAKAGQSVRLLDIPVAGKYGIFDELHGHSSGAGLSQTLRDAAAKHYGHAGKAFVKALIGLKRDGLNLSEALKQIEARFGNVDGQEGRAARMLAVSALAGEVAISAGILPWATDTAIEAAIAAFHLWSADRGAGGRNAEHVAILRAVADFIERYSDSRFSELADFTPKVNDRAGYWKDDEGRRLYLFTSGGLREATKGYDLKRVLTALDEAGALAAKGTKGERAISTRCPGSSVAKLYHIDPKPLVGAA